MRILFTGGGTGGHVFPIVAIVREIRRIYQRNDLDFYYIGPKDEFGLILLAQEGFLIKTIISGKIRRYLSFENFVDIFFKIPFGILQSFYLILKIRPQIIFSKGGSGSISVTISARLLRIPVFLHESDIVPGLSNRIASKWAKKVFVSFPKTEYFDQKEVILTGNPIRKDLLEGDEEKATELFDLTLQKPIILFMGGSQGAEKINDFVMIMINRLVKDFEIIHVCGRNNVKQVAAEVQVVMEKELEKYYHPIGFLDEEKLKHAYKVADFIVSRAGSGSIFEIAAVGKPSVLIPLPSSAADHQFKNAYFYSETGAALIMEQDNLSDDIFLERIHLLFLRQEKLEQMKEAALRFSKPLAARTIAREILEYLMLE